MTAKKEVPKNAHASPMTFERTVVRSGRTKASPAVDTAADAPPAANTTAPAGSTGKS